MPVQAPVLILEPDIRKAVHAKLLGHHHRNAGSLVVDELGVRHGRSRIDIAVVSRRLGGIEIKSDNDTLRRLPEQLSEYNLVFSRLTLVTTRRHLCGARELLPTWWGIVVASAGPRGAIRFERVHQATPNPQIDPVAIARLLWRDEVVELLRSRGARGRLLRQPRRVLYQSLTQLFSATEIQGLVTQTLKTRQHWRTGTARPSAPA